jgi:hypothetical protein
MPLAYNTPHMSKVVVPAQLRLSPQPWVTDGNNNWNDWTGGVPGVGKDASNNTVNYHRDKDYTAYGRLLPNTWGLSTSDPTTTLNTWMSDMCTAFRQNGIVIYTPRQPRHYSELVPRRPATTSFAGNRAN